MKNCPVCGDPTDSLAREIFWHFRFIEFGQWRFWRGNIRTFGWRSGMMANLTLSFPFFNTLWHWKHRKSRLVFPKDWQP